MTAAPIPASTAAGRGALRSDVNIAGQALTPYWPIETFIAVNPLGGYEGLPFATAIRRAGEWVGARGTVAETTFRRLHAAGRIADDQLDAALAHHVEDIAQHPGVAVPNGHIGALDILRCDMLYGQTGPDPARVSTTRSEQVCRQVADLVDNQTGKWCAAFFGAAHTAWPMPGAERGLYAAWRDLAGRDRSLPSSVRRRLRLLPARPDDAATAALADLGVCDDARVGYLRAHLTAMPGWASHVRWHGEHGDAADLTQYLAMRLVYEAELLRHAGLLNASCPPSAPAPQPPSTHARAVAVATRLAPAQASDRACVDAIADVLELLGVSVRPLVWQRAYEWGYRAPLLAELAGQPLPAPAARPAAQVVCCIDTRSEELRRQVEALGPYETLGFAGFFAVAISYRGWESATSSEQCPVLLRPRNEITEHPDPSVPEGRLARARAGRVTLAAGEDAFDAAKNDTLAPFSLAEVAGWAAGPLAAVKTVAPRLHDRVRDRLRRAVSPVATTRLGVAEGFTVEDRQLFAEAALTMMGLTANFAPLVVLCGHGSTTENNPYESALHCGACGGNRGAPNARTAAAILNDVAVREHLAARGIDVPADTWFVAAEHDTARDTVTVLDPHLVPAGHREALGRLVSAPAPAGAPGPRPIGGLGAGLPRMGAGRQCLLHRGAADHDRRHRLGPAGVPALLRRRGRPGRRGAGDHPHRPADRGPVDQPPVLLLHGRSGGVRRRHQDNPQRGRHRRRARRPQR